MSEIIFTDKLVCSWFPLINANFILYQHDNDCDYDRNLDGDGNHARDHNDNDPGDSNEINDNCMLIFNDLMRRYSYDR